VTYRESNGVTEPLQPVIINQPPAQTIIHNNDMRRITTNTATAISNTSPVPPGTPIPPFANPNVLPRPGRPQPPGSGSGVPPTNPLGNSDHRQQLPGSGGPEKRLDDSNQWSVSSSSDGSGALGSSEDSDLSDVANTVTHRTASVLGNNNVRRQPVMVPSAANADGPRVRFALESQDSGSGEEDSSESDESSRSSDTAGTGAWKGGVIQDMLGCTNGAWSIEAARFLIDNLMPVGLRSARFVVGLAVEWGAVRAVPGSNPPEQGISVLGKASRLLAELYPGTTRHTLNTEHRLGVTFKQGTSSSVTFKTAVRQSGVFKHRSTDATESDLTCVVAHLTTAVSSARVLTNTMLFGSDVSISVSMSGGKSAVVGSLAMNTSKATVAYPYRVAVIVATENPQLPGVLRAMLVPLGEENAAIKDIIVIDVYPMPDASRNVLLDRINNVLPVEFTDINSSISNLWKIRKGFAPDRDPGSLDSIEATGTAALRNDSDVFFSLAESEAMFLMDGIAQAVMNEGKFDTPPRLERYGYKGKPVVFQYVASTIVDPGASSLRATAVGNASDKVRATLWIPNDPTNTHRILQFDETHMKPIDLSKLFRHGKLNLRERIKLLMVPSAGDAAWLSGFPERVDLQFNTSPGRTTVRTLTSNRDAVFVAPVENRMDGESRVATVFVWRTGADSLRKLASLGYISSMWISYTIAPVDRG